MPQGMEYMYDDGLRQKAVELMQQRGVPMSGDNLQRAMALLNLQRGPEEDAVNVQEAATSPKLTGDLLSQYMEQTDRPTAQPAKAKSGSGATGDGKTSQPSKQVTPPQSEDSGASPPPAAASGRGEGPTTMQRIKQGVIDAPSKIASAASNTFDDIGDALMALPMARGARMAMAGGSKLAELASPTAQKLLTGPKAVAQLEAPAAQKLIGASSSAKNRGAIELLAERIVPALRRIQQKGMQTSQPGTVHSVRLD